MTDWKQKKWKRKTFFFNPYVEAGPFFWLWTVRFHTKSGRISAKSLKIMSRGHKWRIGSKKSEKQIHFYQTWASPFLGAHFNVEASPFFWLRMAQFHTKSGGIGAKWLKIVSRGHKRLIGCKKSEKQRHFFAKCLAAKCLVAKCLAAK